MASSYMTRAISTVDEAKAFIAALEADGKLFHFDDSPETIVDCLTGLPTFTAEECEYIDRRVSELFSVPGLDPFEVALALVGHTVED